MIPRIYEGQTVHICAGGPSLAGFDFSRLNDRAVIAVNRTFEVMPAAQVLYWSDARFFRSWRREIIRHPAPWKASLDLDYQAEELVPPEIHLYRCTGRAGFDPDPASLRHGNNSAYAAMHLAVHLGARRIILLGVDMRFSPEGRSHFHEGYGMLPVDFAKSMLPHFRTLVKPLASFGVEVINASPASALKLWPRMSIDEALK